MEKNDAAEQFYHTYYHLIYRTAKRLCRTKEEQEELIQDSLLRFLKNLAYYTERNSDETSALIVLTMQCQKVDTFRKLHPEKWADWEDEAIEVTVSLKREAESRAFRRSEILLLMEALEPEDRYLLQSYYIAGTSIRALAKDLRISVITTKRAYDELEADGFLFTCVCCGQRNVRSINGIYHWRRL